MAAGALAMSLACSSSNATAGDEIGLSGGVADGRRTNGETVSVGVIVNKLLMVWRRKRDISKGERLSILN